ncbi:hypothetical protein COOONC_27501 [Cooperia oncophora]
MHSVQVEVQYVYIAEAICEYGRAMGYWNQPALLNQFARFKASFDDYVLKLNVQTPPPPIPAQMPPQPMNGQVPQPPLPGQMPPPAPPGQAPPPSFGGVPAAPPVPSPCASPMDGASPRPSQSAPQMGAAPAPPRPTQVANAFTGPPQPARPSSPAPAGGTGLQGTSGAPPGGPPGSAGKINAQWPPKQGVASVGAIPGTPQAFSPSDQGRVLSSVYICP